MRVTVRMTSPLSIRVEPLSRVKEGIKSEETELEVPGDTLWDLLLKLNDRYKSIMARFVDPQTERISDYEVFVNGRWYDALPGGIHAKLKEGDEIEISIPMPGGG